MTALRWLFVATIAFWITSAAAQKDARTLIKNDPRGQYEIIKKAFKTKAASPNDIRKRLSGTEAVNAGDCGDTTIGAQSTDPVATWLLLLAVEVVLVSETFIAAGYPDKVWKPSLSEFERLQVESIVKRKRIDGDISVRYAQRITKAASEYRKTARPPVKNVYWEVECGGGGVTLQVVTNPKNGTVTLMNELFHLVCTAQGLNPKSFAECNLFDEVRDGEHTTFTGVYYYSVKWPDGKTQSATRKDFNKHRNSEVLAIRRSDI